MIAETMIEEIPLPGNTVLACEKFFPIFNRLLHARFLRKCDDGMQMIWHEEGDAAMPDEPVMIMRDRGEKDIANARAAKLVFAARFAVDGDEKEGSIWNPLWYCMWQSLTNGMAHGGKAKHAGHSVQSDVCGRARLSPARRVVV